MIGSAIAAEEFGAIARPRGVAAAKVGKRDAITEFIVPGVACEHDARFPIHLGNNEWCGGAPGNAEHPLYIRSHGEVSRAARVILDRKTGNFYGIVRRYELQEVEGDFV